MAKIHAHQLVDATAQALAESLFEDLMSDNQIYGRFRELAGEWSKWRTQAEQFPRDALRKRFIAFAKPRLLRDARATLAAMLQGPTTDALKQTISEALILDGALVGHRTGPLN